jgi:excisionase family DNA binding protein
MTEPAERLRTKREAAQYLGISVYTVEKLMRTAGLRYVKLTAGAVRFRDCDLAEFVEQRVRTGPARLNPAGVRV